LDPTLFLVGASGKLGLRQWSGRLTRHSSIHCSDDQKEVSMREKVEKAIDEIRPFLQADGGNIELIDIQEGVVKVKLVGACGSCPMSQLTLKRGVEARLKAQVPEVKEVIAV
jgi:Fe-S cluster biogenesis protein NfuA